MENCLAIPGKHDTPRNQNPVVEEWNAIEVTQQRGKSELSRCLGYPPIKWINPRPQNGCCQVSISNYGGGLVDGDAIKMRVDCLRDSRLYLGTQSSTKVYRSHGKGGCTQETLGTVHANALAVVCPDPVVPFKDSRYYQTQNWEVHPTGNLILFDWLQPGRVARGEVFAYESLRSDFRVTRPGGIPLLSEKFNVNPGSNYPLRCGQFGAYQSYLSIYLVGVRALQLAEMLEEKILRLNNSDRNGYGHTGEVDSGPGIWVGTGKREGEAYMIRAMGGDRRDLQPLHDLMFTALAEPEWLGFNPWERRY